MCYIEVDIELTEVKEAIMRKIASILLALCMMLAVSVGTMALAVDSNAAGKTYKVPQHGFARDNVFSLVRSDATSATYLFRNNEKTAVNYPFDFQGKNEEKQQNENCIYLA